MAFSLFWLDPNEAAYLWLAYVSLVTLIGNAIILLVNFTTWIGQTPGVVFEDVILTPVRIGLWVLFWAYWFRLGIMWSTASRGVGNGRVAGCRHRDAAPSALWAGGSGA